MRKALLLVGALILVGVLAFSSLALAARITGTNAPDRLIGTGERDRIAGGNGDDIVSGRGNNDRLDGDSGNDAVRGNKGNDKVFGSAHPDLLRGGRGADEIISVGGGADEVRGGPGYDRCRVGTNDFGGGCELVTQA